MEECFTTNYFYVPRTKIKKMASLIISGEEKHYITTGVEEDFRNDGRSCEDYRKVCVKTRVLSNTNGSSEVTLVSSQSIL